MSPFLAEVSLFKMPVYYFPFLIGNTPIRNHPRVQYYDQRIMGNPYPDSSISTEDPFLL